MPRVLIRTDRQYSRSRARLLKQYVGFRSASDLRGRCGWSKANLVVALSSLLKECDAHREAFRVPSFGGLDVVFREDPSVLHKGETAAAAVAVAVAVCTAT